MPDNQKMTAGGFLFSDEIVAEKAKKEMSAISYMRNQMLHMNDEQKLEAFKGLIDKQVFDTAVGYSFLKELRTELVASDSIDNADIPLIPVAGLVDVKDTEVETQKLKWQRKYHILFPFTIMLLGCVIFMFVVAATSNNLTILDYKNKIENKYASWEEDLTKRENEVKEREEKLLQKEQNLKNGEQDYGSEENTGS